MCICKGKKIDSNKCFKLIMIVILNYLKLVYDLRRYYLKVYIYCLEVIWNLIILLIIKKVWSWKGVWWYDI